MACECFQSKTSANTAYPSHFLCARCHRFLRMFQFDEGRNDLTEDLTAENIKKFIVGNQLPTVIEFTQEVRDCFLLLILRFREF